MLTSPDHRRGVQLLSSAQVFDACARVIRPWIASSCKLSYLCMIALHGRAYRSGNDGVLGHIPYQDQCREHVIDWSLFLGKRVLVTNGLLGSSLAWSDVTKVLRVLYNAITICDCKCETGADIVGGGLMLMEWHAL